MNNTRTTITNHVCVDWKEVALTVLNSMGLTIPEDPDALDQAVMAIEDRLDELIDTNHETVCE